MAGEKTPTTGAEASRRATSADVARESGVSRATVSYVLNDTPNRRIPPATRELVLETARRLGHVPNPLARALKTGTSNIVVALVPALTLGFVFDHALDGLTNALADRGYALLINRVTSFDESGSVSGLWRHVSPRLIITIGGIAPDDIGRLTRDAPAPVITDDGIIEHHRIGELQAGHLLASGRQRLAFAMPADPALRVYAELRLAGVAAACRDRGVDAPRTVVVGDDLDSHLAAVETLRTTGVDGVCAHNDDVALLLLDALGKRGLDAPKDLAVIGSDDVPLAQSGLTTIALDLEVCAAAFVNHVLVALDEAPVETPPRDMLQLITRLSA
jgi:DNA-binding LacI/PurR family transcriptional regulator